MEDVVTLHAQVTCITVCQAEIIPVAYMQLGAGGVGEHLQYIFLGLVAVLIEMIQPGICPDFLPFFFNLR